VVASEDERSILGQEILAHHLNATKEDREQELAKANE